jgi:predicted transcriptional regulator
MLAVKNYAQSMEPPKIDVFSKNSIERIRKISEELRDN